MRQVDRADKKKRKRPRQNGSSAAGDSAVAAADPIRADRLRKRERER